MNAITTLKRHAALLAGAAMALAITGGAAQASPGAPAHHSACGAPYRTHRGESLVHVGLVALSPLSQILADTLKCNGGRFPYDVGIYLNGGDMHAKMIRGSRLWFSYLTVTRALRDHPGRLAEQLVQFRA